MKSVLSPEKVQAFRVEIERQLHLLREEAKEVRCAGDCQDVVQGMPEQICLRRSEVRLLHLPCAEMRACIDALHRIRLGRFGICVCCGEHVELSRLNADPSSAYCIRCHSAGGRKLKRAG